MYKLEKLILENDDLLFLTISNDGLITNCSNGFAKKLGLTQPEVAFKEYIDHQFEKNEQTELKKKIEELRKTNATLAASVSGVGSDIYKYFKLGKDQFSITFINRKKEKVFFKLKAQSLENKEILIFCEDRTSDIVNGVESEKLISNLPLIIYKCKSDKSREMLFITDDVYSLTGFSAEEYLRNKDINIPNKIHPDDKVMVDVMIEFCTDNNTHYELEYRILDSKNNIKWVLERGRPYLNPHNKIVECLTGTLLDITQIKHKETQVSDQAELVSKITETLPSIVMVYNFKLNKLVYSNFKLYEILGYGPDDLTFNGSNFLEELVTPDFMDLMELSRRKIDFLKDDEVYEAEYSLKHKKGHIVFCSDRSIILRRDILGNPLEVLTLLEDITVKKKILNELEQEKLKSVHSSKMATLGEMAGGIAHEINNPLAIIVGKVNQLKKLHAMKKMTDESLLDGLDKVDKNCFRISKIIQGLRSFSRSGDNDPFIKNSLNQIITDTLELCMENLNKKSIELRTDLKSDYEIECRAVHISQVILNLIHNARDAIENLDEKWIQVATQLTSNNEVEISVTDCGPGIPEEVQKKLMQPFFTTKELGKGTGLGLSIAQGIIQTHNGEFYYDKTSKNTRFVIKIPLAHLEKKPN